MRLGSALAALALLACTGVGVQVVQPPPEFPEPPMPERFEGEEPPQLVPTNLEGILAAPAVDPHLYFSSSDQLWYRYHRGQWYQAFRWNGYWFPPENVPSPLRAGPPAPGPPEPGD